MDILTIIFHGKRINGIINSLELTFIPKMQNTSYFGNEPNYLHNESEDLLEVQDNSIEYYSDWDSVCADWRDRCED